jgi:glucose dehydrogenase
MKALFAALTILSSVAAPAMATEPDGEWRMAARDYANTRFSPLAEITPANLGKLSLAFTFSTGVLRGHEAAPIVADNTMFIVTPYPNLVYALDLTKPGAPQKSSRRSASCRRSSPPLRAAPSTATR